MSNKSEGKYEGAFGLYQTYPVFSGFSFIILVALVIYGFGFSYRTTNNKLGEATPSTPGQTASTPGQTASTPGQTASTPGQTASTPGQTTSTPPSQTAQEAFENEIEAKKHLWGVAGIFGTIATAFAGFAVAFNVLEALKNREIAESKQLSEDFVEAIKLLGDKEQVQVRIGGIYALEQLVRNSKGAFAQTVVDILSAFIREVSWLKNTNVEVYREEIIRVNKESSIRRVSTDIQAALDTIRNLRDEYQDSFPSDYQVDLTKSNLKHAWLNGEKQGLAKARFWSSILDHGFLEGAELPKSNFWGAQLVHANLRNGNFKGAIFGPANFRKANLVGANLEGANLEGADFREADLKDATLAGAFLLNTKFEGCKNLTLKQLNEAFLVCTSLPEKIKGLKQDENSYWLGNRSLFIGDGKPRDDFKEVAIEVDKIRKSFSKDTLEEEFFTENKEIHPTLVEEFIKRRSSLRRIRDSHEGNDNKTKEEARDEAISESRKLLKEILRVSLDRSVASRNDLSTQFAKRIRDNFQNKASILVAENLTWYPFKDQPWVSQTPSIMVVFGRPQREMSSYQQWLEGNIAPQIIFEFSAENNYLEMPQHIMGRLRFYENFGVEEYYLLDTEQRSFRSWHRQNNRLEHVQVQVSPRLNIPLDQFII